MIITKIIKLKRKGCEIQMDDGNIFHWATTTVVKFCLKKNQEVSSTLFNEIIQYQNHIAAFESAYNYATYQPRSELQVRNKLKLLKFDVSTINNTINKLKELHIIDDSEFCRKYVEAKLIKKTDSFKHIKYKLLALGVEEEIIDYTIMMVQDVYDDYLKVNGKEIISIKEVIIQNLIAKKLRLISSKPPQKQMQLTLNYLISKGFSYDEVKPHLLEILNSKTNDNLSLENEY